MSDLIFMGLTEYEFFKIELEDARKTKTISEFDKQLKEKSKALGFENSDQYIGFILSQHLLAKNPNHQWFNKY